jgi:hypothetical protein
MATKQGDVALLNDPVAQKLLQSTIPARLAYNWSDGTPRVVPIWFHWNGEQIVLAGPPTSPKMKVLTQGTKVALTIDDKDWPYKILLVRGTVLVVEVVEGMVPEYVASAQRYLGEGSTGFLEMYENLFPEENGRVTVQPEWVAVIDMEARFPSSFEGAM